MGNIRRGFPKHNLSKHYAKYHNKKVEGTMFLPIEKFTPHWRGTNKVCAISKIETQWIYNMQSYIPHGLNVDWDINCFLNNA